MLWETFVCENGTHNCAQRDTTPLVYKGFSSYVHLVLTGFGGEKVRHCDVG